MAARRLAAGKNQRLVVVPLRFRNNGTEPWQVPIAAKAVLIDTLGVSHPVAKTVKAVPSYPLLPGRTAVGPGQEVTGYAVFAVPKDRPLAAMRDGVPSTYVPARNTIFLAFALAFAETIGSTDIFIGANAIDYSGYPDCRPEFLAAFQHMARLGTRMGSEGAPLTVHAPLIELTKADIVRRGQALGVNFALTRTCYDPSPDGAACGRCDACQLRLKGFREAGFEDPAPYAIRSAGTAS